ncbi:MAG: processing protein [Solirubrobacteraceae bacterium]|nr:processing protein [Solirubrobacteraceae bacterium]
MISDEAERLALAALVRVSEPGDPLLAREVATAGPIEAWGRRMASHPEVDPGRELAVAALAGMRLICPGDDEWPVSLDDLDKPGPAGELGAPIALWLRGPLKLNAVTARAIGIVGSRAATSYGLHVAGEFAFRLAEQGWSVVSGAAYGIDAAAHRGALAAPGPTVAVLACGVDVAYPRSHDALLARIASEGLVVSEAPPGGLPLRRRFLVRNRLIAALSSGSVVVEAGVRSGALSTSRHARRIGRPVMAVPGPVTSGMSSGCHLVLRQWPESVLVTNADEVIECAGPMGMLAPLPLSPAGPRDGLDEVVARVLEAVPSRRPRDAQWIAERSGESEFVVERMLAPLLANGLIESRPEGYRLTALGREPSGGAAP